MAVYPHRFPSCILEQISRFVADIFLFPLGLGNSDEFTDYVISNASLEEVLQSRWGPRSPCHIKRIIALGNGVEVLDESQWISTPAFRSTP